MSSDDIEHGALDLIEQYGEAAMQIARVRGEIAEENVGNQHLARTWRDIANAIERIGRVRGCASDALSRPCTRVDKFPLFGSGHHGSALCVSGSKGTSTLLPAPARGPTALTIKGTAGKRLDLSTASWACLLRSRRSPESASRHRRMPCRLSGS